jgi:hypothetical protein
VEKKQLEQPDEVVKDLNIVGYNAEDKTHTQLIGVITKLRAKTRDLADERNAAVTERDELRGTVATYKRTEAEAKIMREELGDKLVLRDEGAFKRWAAKLGSDGEWEKDFRQLVKDFAAEKPAAAEGDKKPEEKKPAEGDKKPGEDKKPAEGDKKPGEDKKPAEGDKKPEDKKPEEGDKKPGEDKKPAEGDKKPEDKKPEEGDKKPYTPSWRRGKPKAGTTETETIEGTDIPVPRTMVERIALRSQNPEAYKEYQRRVRKF